MQNNHSTRTLYHIYCPKSSKPVLYSDFPYLWTYSLHWLPIRRWQTILDTIKLVTNFSLGFLSNPLITSRKSPINSMLFIHSLMQDSLLIELYRIQYHFLTLAKCPLIEAGYLIPKTRNSSLSRSPAAPHPSFRVAQRRRNLVQSAISLKALRSSETKNPYQRRINTSKLTSTSLKAQTPASLTTHQAQFRSSHYKPLLRNCATYPNPHYSSNQRSVDFD